MLYSSDLTSISDALDACLNFLPAIYVETGGIAAGAEYIKKHSDVIAKAARLLETEYAEYVKEWV